MARELIQGDALPDVQVSGLPKPQYMGRDTSAEAGLTGNVLELGAAELNARAAKKQADAQASMGQFTDILKRGLGRFTMEAGPTAATSKQYIEATNPLSESYDPTKAKALVSYAVGREVSDEEAKKFLGAEAFSKIRSAVSQGHSTETAAKIAVEAQVKKLIAQKPELADMIRQTAAREAGFDPMAEFNATLSRFGRPTQDKAQELSKTQKDLLDLRSEAEARHPNDLAKQDSWFAEARDLYFQRNDLARRRQALEDRQAAGQVTGADATAERMSLLVEELPVTLTTAVSAALQSNGIDLGAIEVLSPEQSKVLDEAINSVVSTETNRIYRAEIAAGNNQPDVLAIRAQVEGLVKDSRDFLKSRDATSMYKAYNELFAENAKMSVTKALPVLTAIQSTFGQDALPIMQWLSQPKNKFAKEQLSRVTGVNDVQAMLDKLSTGVQQFQRQAMRSPETVLSQQGTSPAPTPEQVVVAKAVMNGMPADDKTVVAVYQSASDYGKPFSSVMLSRLDKGVKPSDGEKNYASRMEGTVTNPDAVREVAVMAIRDAVATARRGRRGVGGANITFEEVMGSVQGIEYSPEGIFTIAYTTPEGASRKLQGYAPDAFKYNVEGTAAVAESGYGHNLTGVSSKSGAELYRNVNKALNDALSVGTKPEAKDE